MTRSVNHYLINLEPVMFAAKFGMAHLLDLHEVQSIM
jgi:hypothetical protein